MNKLLAGLVIGDLVLLLICFFIFEGKMIPAMWELTSIIWMLYWGMKCLNE